MHLLEQVTNTCLTIFHPSSNFCLLATDLIGNDGDAKNTVRWDKLSVFNFYTAGHAILSNYYQGLLPTEDRYIRK
jgi:hypothetical protein